MYEQVYNYKGKSTYESMLERQGEIIDELDWCTEPVVRDVLLAELADVEEYIDTHM